MLRLRIAKAILWCVLGAAVVVGLMRFIHGLGATTALTDLTPWGFWIGFDVMGGVALAAGGFVIAATVHVFRLERYHSIVRPAILTAMLGYIAVPIGLLFDLGLPWNIFNMIVWWNPHSPLFEVGWCVMLYNAVLIIEFMPVVLEMSKHPILKKVHGILQKFSMVFVILGIMLSTLHQSSLGSLALIQPHRLHPLWYTPLLPILFFISAIALGLMMVTTESLVTGWLYEKKQETHILKGLGRAVVPILGLWLVVRFADLAIRGQLWHLFEGTFDSWLFITEISISALIPMILLSIPKVRESAVGLVSSSLMVVIGMVMNRIDVGGFAGITTTGARYVPSWMEVLISAGIVAGVILVFFFFVERFRVWEEPAYNRKAWASKKPRFDANTLTWQGDPAVGDLARNSFMFVAAAAFTFALLPDMALSGPEAKDQPVHEARGSDLLFVDGDRDGDLVVFDHTAHQDRNGESKSCGLCHHMNLPQDESTTCATCHADMGKPTDIFDHDEHVEQVGGTQACSTCHSDLNQTKSAQTAKRCFKCHDGMVSAEARVVPEGPNPAPAAGYVDAMHEMCVTCHTEAVEFGQTQNEKLDECATCHSGTTIVTNPQKPDAMPPVGKVFGGGEEK